MYRKMHSKTLNPIPSHSWIVLTLALSSLTPPSTPSLISFIYVGCSQPNYTPGGPYATALDSILSSILTSATSSSFNAFNISTNDAAAATVYALFQCRGDLAGSDCNGCVSEAVRRLRASCSGTTGGALQLEGCLVRYDSAPFVGEVDKTVASEKCGPSAGDGPDGRDAVLADLMAGIQPYRVGESGKVQGVAQCVEDLSASVCQDCLTEAIQRLRSECGKATWGDMFLGKCYARYSNRGFTKKKGYDAEEDEKTLAIFVGIVAGVAVLIAFFSVLRKVYLKGASGK